MTNDHDDERLELEDPIMDVQTIARACQTLGSKCDDRELAPILFMLGNNLERICDDWYDIHRKLRERNGPKLVG